MRVDGSQDADSEMLEAEVDVVEVPTEEASALLGLALQAAPARVGGTAALGTRTGGGGNRDEASTPESGRKHTGSRPRSATRPGTGQGQTRHQKRFFTLPATPTIRKALAIFANEPLPFLVIALLASLPSILGAMGLVSWGRGLTGFAIRTIAVQTIVNLFLGVTCYCVFEITRSGSVDLVKAFSKGLGRLLPVAATSCILVFLSYSGLYPALFIVGPFHPLFFGRGLRFYLAIMVILLPMLLVACIFRLAIPACVVEKKGAIASVVRSFHLTEGVRGSIFWILACWGVLYFCVYLLASVMIVRFLGRGVPWKCAQIALEVFFLTIGNIITGVIYHDIRAAKEGLTAEKLVRVFT